MAKTPRRVVVTGLGVVAPNAIGLDEYRRALQQGRSGIGAVDELKHNNFICQIGGIPALDEERILETLPFDAYHHMTEPMVYASLAAVECARSSGENVDLKRSYLDGSVDWATGAMIGTGLFGGIEKVWDELFPVMQKAPEAEPGRGTLPLGADSVSQNMGSSVSVCVGRLLGLGGQVGTNSSACNTGTEAIFEGWKQIQLSYAESMYVGGTEGSHFGIWAGFDAMRDVLCRHFNAMPEKGSRPMSASACGFVPGSGAGMLRLESLESAQRRKAPILAELVGAFCNSGGQRDGGTMTFPNADGVVRCIRRVLDDSGVKPDQISLINGHLTSTMADPLEIGNWRKALGLSPEHFPLVQSTKSMIGHALGAAGALEAVAAIDQLSRGYVHPSINCEDVHREIVPIAASIPRQALERRLEYVIKASFGFGDVNGCLLFKRWAQA